MAQELQGVSDPDQSPAGTRPDSAGEALAAPETILTRTAINSLRADGILQLVYLPEAWETLTDAQANVAAGATLNPGKRRPLLVDIRAMHGIDREARTYYSSLHSITARALLVESLVTRVMANFFIRLNQPPVPTRLFTSEDEAVAWLKGFVE